MRSGTHNFTERLRMEHGDMAKALREKFSSQEKPRRDAVREMLGEFNSDIRQAGQIWRKKGKIATEAPAEKKEIRKKPEEEKDKVLEVIARYPEGVKLIDIGNELGVDWRTLIGPTKSLVDEGEVVKIDTMYYPK